MVRYLLVESENSFRTALVDYYRQRKTRTMKQQRRIHRKNAKLQRGKVLVDAWWLTDWLTLSFCTLHACSTVTKIHWNPRVEDSLVAARSGLTREHTIHTAKKCCWLQANRIESNLLQYKDQILCTVAYFMCCDWLIDWLIDSSTECMFSLWVNYRGRRDVDVDVDWQRMNDGF